jgi:putative aldouronate transport system permease protein
MKIKTSGYVILFNVIAYAYIGFVTLFCLLPFVIIISGSFTSDHSIIIDGYHLIPKVWSLEAYDTLFKYPKMILDAYAVTTGNTIIGTALGLFMISMAGYVLSRKDFKYRNKLSFFIYFTTLFGGGLVPWYIMIVRYFNLKDNLISICYPGLMTPFLIILMRTFISSSLPDEIVESAKIDGSGHFRTYRDIVIPIIMPGIATVALFLSLNYWNDWFLASMFITTPSKYELQFFLYNMLNSMLVLNTMLSGKGITLSQNLPTESTKLAMAVIATGPVLLFYPFVQRYFISGLTIGAVKG